MEVTSRVMRSFGVIQQASALASTSQAILPSGTVLLSYWSRSVQTLCSDWLLSYAIKTQLKALKAYIYCLSLCLNGTRTASMH